MSGLRLVKLSSPVGNFVCRWSGVLIVAHQYAHLFWQGAAVIAGGALLFFLGRWMDAKLKAVQTTETISLRQAMKDEEE